MILPRLPFPGRVMPGTMILARSEGRGKQLWRLSRLGSLAKSAEPTLVDSAEIPGRSRDRPPHTHVSP